MLKFSLQGHDFVLRDLRPADVESYLAFFNELSEESIRCRFGHLLAKLTPFEAEERTRINTASEKVLAIFDDKEERMVAIGRCYLDARTQNSEVAFVVSETTRRLGLGRFLLQQLIRVAQSENSKSTSAFIATRNAPVVKLLQSAGFVMPPANDGDDLQLILMFPSRGLGGANPVANPSNP